MIMTDSLMLAVHLLGAAVWVGGMAFALLVLRPSLGVLAPAQRLALHSEVFRRFFRIIWHVMPLVLLSGYGLLFTYGGFAGVSPIVHVMHVTGVTMAVIFAVIFFGPWQAMQSALAASDAAGAAAAVNKIRILIGVNLMLGTLTIGIAAFA